MSEKIVAIGDEEFRVAIEASGAIRRIAHGGETDAIEIVRIGEGEAEMRVNGRSEIVPYVVDGDTIHFSFRGEAFTAVVAQPSQRPRQRHREHSMSAPMPGAVLKIFVAPGDVVSKGTPLLILEAMKMEHQITASWDGTVKAIRCSVGDLVQPGIDLIEIEE